MKKRAEILFLENVISKEHWKFRNSKTVKNMQKTAEIRNDAI